MNSGDKAFKIVLIDILNYYKYNGNMGRIQLLRKKFKIKNGEGVKYMYYVGKKIHLQTSLDVAHEYKNLSEKDLDAANLLMINGLYNEAYYYFIQSMEKNIKKRICEIIDITNPFFSNQMKDIGHSLDNAIEFLLRLISGNNKIMYEQIRNQIVEGVLKGIKFSSVHNNVRYPYYNPNKKEYVCLVITSEDCYEIQQMEKKLKVFLNELHRL